MTCKANELVKLGALVMLQEFARCVQENGIDGCGAAAANHLTYKYLYRYGIPGLCEFLEPIPSIGDYIPNPEDPDPPWPWPPNWSAASVKELGSRIQRVEDLVFILADIVTQPDGEQIGIGSLLRDPEIHLEAATRVQEVLDSAASGIAAEIERLSQL